MLRYRKSIPVALIVALILLYFILPCINAERILPGNQWTGPFMDKIIIRDEPINPVQSLLDKEVDIVVGGLNPLDIDPLREMEDIEVVEYLRYGYGITHLNCESYPLNYSGVRRAISFAVDKQKVIDEGWWGMASPLDCSIPRQHPASIENEMEFHYYDPLPEIGNQILDGLGFVDLNDDGWREGPDGQQLDEMEIIADINDITIVVCEALKDACHSIGLPARIVPTTFAELTHRVYYHEDYDMIFLGTGWSSPDLDRWAKNLHSDYIDDIYFNEPNWSNESWDELADIVLHSTDYDEILNAARMMAHIWVEQCPDIVMYQNTYYGVYRTDELDGFIQHEFDGPLNFLTKFHIHKKEGPLIGGVLRVPGYLTTLSLNMFVVHSGMDILVVEDTQDMLIRIGPEGEEIPWMAEDFTIETSKDNPQVPEGHTRFTIDIVKNATWSDGKPIDAFDFVYTLNFFKEFIPVWGEDLKEMISCYATTNYELVCEFSTESYWHWHSIGYIPLTPIQTFMNYTPRYWEYQPTPETLDEIVVSGPYKPTVWIPGEFLEYSQNPLYWKNPRLLPNETTPITTTSLSTFTSTNDPDNFFIMGVSGTVSATIVVFIGVIIIKNYKKEPH